MAAVKGARRPPGSHANRRRENTAVKPAARTRASSAATSCTCSRNPANLRGAADTRCCGTRQRFAMPPRNPARAGPRTRRRIGRPRASSSAVHRRSDSSRRPCRARRHRAARGQPTRRHPPRTSLGPVTALGGDASSRSDRRRGQVEAGRAHRPAIEGLEDETAGAQPTSRTVRPRGRYAEPAIRSVETAPSRRERARFA